MKLFVGITDDSWYEQLSRTEPPVDEVNFWKPGGQRGFRGLQPGEIFLFKLHSPNDFIVGGAHFVRFSRLPMSLAWLAFGENNGVKSEEEFHRRISKYRRRTGGVEPGPDPTIGNIILTQPFWLPRDKWIPVPDDWQKNAVEGMYYDPLSPSGSHLWAQVQVALRDSDVPNIVREAPARYAEATAKMRLGQGAFRVSVTEAYERRCAITGENILPVLQASHIQPYAKEGPHEVPNGILLRSDMHTLFDKGLLTVTPDHTVEVSSQIREQFVNGKLYYSFHGERLRNLPRQVIERPARERLEWHADNVFQA